MTTRGPLTLRRRANVWQKESGALLLGVPVLTSEPLQPVEETVAGLRLSSTDNLREGLSAKDLAAVTKAVTAACIRLEKRVVTSGAVMAPAGAAWRICDGEGREVERSLPVVVGEYLAQGITAVAPIGSDGSVGQLTFSVTPSRLVASVPPLADAGRPAVVELLASARGKQVAPVVTCRIDNPASSAPTLRVSVFPVVMPAAGELLSLRRVATVRAVAGSWVSSGFTPAAESDSPVGLGPIAAGGFMAGCVARHGDVTLWGDITLRHPEEFSLAKLAVAVNESEAWSGAVRVTLADGSKGVFLSGDTGRAPLALSPLICFPHRDAVALEAWVNTASGGIRSVGPIALTPAPEGNYAYALAADFNPREFGPGHSPMPVEGVEFPEAAPKSGMIVCAPATNPLAPCSQADCGAGRVLALATSPRSRSSWQFGCGHLYAFTTEGVWGVGVSSAAGRALSVAALSTGVIRASGHVTPAGDKVVALTAGGREVIAMSGASAKAVATPLPGGKFSAVGSIPATSTLLLRHGEGNLMALDTSRNDCHAISLPFAPALMFTGSEALYLSDGRELTALSASSPAAETTAIKWRAHLVLPPGYPRLCRVAMMMSCSDCDLTLTLSASGYPGAGVAHPTATFQLSGAVRQPFVATFLLPRRPVVEIELSGSVSSDFTFQKIMFQ